MTDETWQAPDDTGHPDLSALLRAELTNAEVSAVGRHLDDCDVCRHDLVDFAVGHALLARTARTLRPAVPAARHAATSPAPPLPPPPAVPTRGLRRAVRPLAVAAAALVLVAGTAGITARLTRSEPAPVASPDQTAVLDPLEGTGGGDVLMAAHGSTVTMTIETHDLPSTRSGQFYYAWLLDPGTNKMLPLGQVGPSGVASFEVPDSLLLRYAAVDVSLEDDDGDPGHSVTSVLRGSYAAEPRTATS